MITRDTLKEFLIASFQNNYKQCYIKTKNDPKHITEKDLRLSQGYLRIWDCGSLKFSKQNLSRRN